MRSRARRRCTRSAISSGVISTTVSDRTPHRSYKPACWVMNAKDRGDRGGTVRRVDARPARYDDVADQYEAMFADRVDDPATAALLDLVGAIDNAKVVDIPCG